MPNLIPIVLFSLASLQREKASAHHSPHTNKRSCPKENLRTPTPENTHSEINIGTSDSNTTPILEPTNDTTTPSPQSTTNTNSTTSPQSTTNATTTSSPQSTSNTTTTSSSQPTSNTTTTSSSQPTSNTTPPNCINCNTATVPSGITNQEVAPGGPNIYAGAAGTTPFVIYVGDLNNIPSYSTPNFIPTLNPNETLGVKDANGRFVLPPLGYPYNALEPFMDTRTLETHHNLIQQRYINNLNRALERYPELFKYTLEELLANPDKLPEDIRNSVMDNAGGDYNHSFFWNSMSPNFNQRPTGNLATAIDRTFGSLNDFNWLFKQIALSTFGVGWAWLLTDPNGNLILATSSKNNTPIPLGLTPLLVIDLWEHAYPFQDQYSRNRYISNWFNIANWENAEKIYSEVLSNKK